MIDFDDYPEVRRVTYGADGAEHDGATFLPICPDCRRFVKADKTISFKMVGGDFLIPKPVEPNATCSKCGRVAMPFEGYF